MYRYAILKHRPKRDAWNLFTWVKRQQLRYQVEIVEFSSEDNILEDLLKQAETDRKSK